MKSYMTPDWTFKSKEARRLFKELDEVEGRDKFASARRKTLRRRAKAAKAESEFILRAWMGAGYMEGAHP